MYDTENDTAEADGMENRQAHKQEEMLTCGNLTHFSHEAEHWTSITFFHTSPSIDLTAFVSSEEDKRNENVIVRDGVAGTDFIF